MKISILLPGLGRKPIGGLKVMYEHANRLAASGHEIFIYHSMGIERGAGIFVACKNYKNFFKNRLRNKFGPASWFKLHSDIKVNLVPELSARFIKPADIVIATAWQTAEWVADFPPSHGLRFYYIQHKEIWSGPEERVLATWKLPLRKLVISRWLESIAHEMELEATYIPNGLDFSSFGLDIDPRARNPLNLLMLYHLEEWKGSKDGINALLIARKLVPELNVTLFGVSEPGSEVPDWMTYVRLPSQSKLRELYNSASVFVAPSLAEGWGLPGSEAMICGAAVVATDIGGHREYCIPDKTAVMVPPSNPNRLATEIVSLCLDDDRRYRLAMQGNQYIQGFTWEKSSSILQATLQAVYAQDISKREDTPHA